MNERLTEVSHRVPGDGRKSGPCRRMSIRGVPIRRVARGRRDSHEHPALGPASAARDRVFRPWIALRVTSRRACRPAERVAAEMVPALCRCRGGSRGRRADTSGPHPDSALAGQLCSRRDHDRDGVGDRVPPRTWRDEFGGNHARPVRHRDVRGVHAVPRRAHPCSRSWQWAAALSADRQPVEPAGPGASGANKRPPNNTYSDRWSATCPRTLAARFSSTSPFAT